MYLRVAYTTPYELALPIDGTYAEGDGVDGVSQRLTSVISRRQQRLPEVLQLMEQWSSVRHHVQDLETAIHAATAEASSDDEVREVARRLQLSTIEPSIAEVETAAAKVRDRFSRDTINIGMSGVARVGKSTLLQSISGLGNGQIPVSRGLPVTAVSSQIYNRQGAPGAQIVFYTWQAFRREVLSPLHDQLGLPSTPATLEEWSDYDYAQVVPSQDSGDAQANLERCSEMQRAIPSFKELFGQQSRDVPIDEISQYVAYPRDPRSNERPYVAVESVRIYCPFPHEDVVALGLIDLPGLGEIAPRAEERHVQTLQTDIDLVLVVKRADDQSAFWGTKDSQAFQLIQKARGPVSQSADFCGIVNNLGGVDPELLRALEHSLGTAAPQVPSYAVDAADPEAVRINLLDPVLARLADRLPVMDDEYWHSLLRESEERASAIAQDVRELRSILSTPRLEGSAAQHLYDLTDKASLQLANELVTLEKALLRRIDEAEDEAYAQKVASCFEAASEWIRTDSYAGDAVTQVLMRMQRDAGSGGVLQAELNRVRVKVSEFFADLDNYFDDEVAELAAAVVTILRDVLGPRIVPSTEDPRQDLFRVAATAEDGEEAAVQFATSLREFAETKFSYRMSLYPYVRDVVDMFLQSQWRNPETGEDESIGAFQVSEEGARGLIREVQNRAEQFAFRCQQELLSLAETPARLMHAVTEQLTDRLLRGDRSLAELAMLTRSYRDDIWPGEFEAFLSARAASAAIRQHVRELEGVLSSMEAGQ